jgi:hypothetical protein
VAEEAVTTPPKAKYIRKAPDYMDDNFSLSEPDSSDEADEEMRERAIADAQEDPQFEERIYYDHIRKKYYRRTRRGMRVNIGGTGFPSRIPNSEDSVDDALESTKSTRKNPKLRKGEMDLPDSDFYDESKNFPLLGM